MFNAFQILKIALISTPIIQPPDWSLHFEIMCDASDYAMGAVLGQTKDRKHHAISYASKTLSGPQLNSWLLFLLLISLNLLSRSQSYCLH